MQALTVGVATGVSPDKWVRTWRERQPRVPISVVPVAEGAALDALRQGDAHLVLVRIPVADAADAELHVIPLWVETPVVVAAKDHPVKVFDAVTLADIAEEEQRDGWDEATLDLVAAGHGVALMPQSVLRATGRRDVVGRPITDAVPTRVGLVWLRSVEGPLIDEFVGVVRGRTANSSRSPEAPAEPPKAAPKRADPKKSAPKQQQRGAQKDRKPQRRTR